MKLKRTIFTLAAAGLCSLSAAAPATAAPAVAPIDEIECYPSSFFATLSGGPAKCFTREEYIQNTIRWFGTLSAGGSSSGS